MNLSSLEDGILQTEMSTQGHTPCPAVTDRKAQMKRNKQHEKSSHHT